MLAGIKFCLHLPLEYSKMWPEKTIIFLAILVVYLLPIREI